MTTTGAGAGSDLAQVGPAASADNPGAELQGAELQGAELQGAELQGAELQGAELQGAELQGAELPVARVVPAGPRLVRAFIAIVLAVLTAAAALLLLLHGIRTDDFPPFIDGQQTTPITRYSGPWLTAAAGMALVAALFLLFAVVDLVRRARGPAGSAE